LSLDMRTYCAARTARVDLGRNDFRTMSALPIGLAPGRSVHRSDRFYLCRAEFSPSVFYNRIPVSGEIQQYRLCDLDALVVRDPVIVEVRATIAFGKFDKCGMDGVRDQNFYRFG
jgi:hypothetical protein